MDTRGREDDIRILSIQISRTLLSELDIRESRHCDIFVDEYLRSPGALDIRNAPQRHGFVDIGALLVTDLPAALLCGLVVEFVKYFFAELHQKIGKMSEGEKIETLSDKFSEEAVKMGMTRSQAENLARKFTEILMVNPFLNP